MYRGYDFIYNDHLVDQLHVIDGFGIGTASRYSFCDGANLDGEQMFQVMVLHLWRICSWPRCSETCLFLVTRIFRICLEWEYIGLGMFGVCVFGCILHIDKYVTSLSTKKKHSVQAPPSPSMLWYNSCSQSPSERTC